MGPHQTKLFGLDSMTVLNMVIDIPQLRYNPTAPSKGKERMYVLEFSELMKRFHLSESDLVLISALPDPIVAYKVALDSGSTIDLGLSGFTMGDTVNLLIVLCYLFNIIIYGCHDFIIFLPV